MNELELKYGCNPNQKPARIFMSPARANRSARRRPGYINFLDAFNGWQLCRELLRATRPPRPPHPSSTSPCRCSRRDAADGDGEKKLLRRKAAAVPPWLRLRKGARRRQVSSYGDWAALSHVCDEETASLLALEVSDGVIAPGYTPKALEILKTKRRGGYNIVKIDRDYVPEKTERKDVFGVVFEQSRNDLKIDETMLSNIVTKKKTLPDGAKRDLILALITLKYTQSNSVCYVKDGQAIGIGAGQQRLYSTARGWLGRQGDNGGCAATPKVLDLPFK
jgi:AICAR transformylase/IMP cyclohydrolase PurH